MRSTLITFLLVLGLMFGLGLPAYGQATTQPSFPTPPRQMSVMIFPFRQIGESGSHTWIPDALNEYLTSQFPVTAMQVLPYDQSNGALEGDAAIAAAHAAHADFAIYGSFQVIDDNLRVNGHVYDCIIDRQLAALTATGDLTDFFKIEDSLGAQLCQAFPIPNNNAAAAPLSNGLENQSLPQTNSAIYPYSAENYDNGYATGNYYEYPYSEYPYAYACPYDDYGYGVYPWFYGGYYGGGYGFNHDRDHFHHPVDSGRSHFGNGGAGHNAWFGSSARSVTPFYSSGSEGFRGSTFGGTLHSFGGSPFGGFHTGGFGGFHPAFGGGFHGGFGGGGGHR